MDSLYLKALIAGICFGVYPLLLQKSGLNGFVSCTVFCFVVWLSVIPFSITKLNTVPAGYWQIVVVSGVISGIGMLFFTSLLANATEHNVSYLILFVTISQVTVTAINQIVTSGGITMHKALGFILAAIAVRLLIVK